MQMWPFLERENIYVIPCADVNHTDRKDLLVYSPLARHAVLLDEEVVAGIEMLLSKGTRTELQKQDGLLQKLLDQLPVPASHVKDPADVRSLTILPNNKCNFSCSYCYSAKGHANKELDINHLYSVLDYFIDKNRISGNELFISFGGGGEPFLSWDIVETGLEYASRRADENGLKISFSFASNGSVINERIIAAIKKYKVKANISFDILEEVQNVQRKHYDIVCNTLDRLFDADIIPSINAVITPLNVLLQEKMVAEIHRRFPKIKRLSFDPVIDASLFEDANDLRKFYSDYTDSFFRARKLGEMLDVNVNCIKLRNLDLLRDRACQGGFDLTPYGTISSCFCISSPKEALYDTFIYGKTDGPGQLVFDTEKFRENQGDRLAGKEQCRDCFAKYHCGGGCLYNYKSYSQEMQEELCRFTREFTRMALLERMADRHPNRVSSPADYTKLSVLLNYKCNFSCTYCYSAKGRSVDEISITDLKAMLDFFIDGSRIESRDLTIFFSGGGEPLLSWDRLKFALEYADVLARKEGFRMNYILITNGSLLDDPIINCLVEHKVNVCVSFEILEEIQNRHRGHYDQVVRGISALISHGLIPSISSVITAQNVDLMEQMVEKINGLFPEIRNLNFDPVADPGAFSTVEELKAFYDAFIDNYFKAHRLSRSRNCGLNCTMRVKYENTGERYCQGKLCLTPLGSVSICHSVSSPKEAAFEKCSYGLVKEGNEPEFDLEKFEALINTNANSYPECKNCFARLHCGGGCLIYRNNYSPEMFEGVCYYTRQFVKRMQLNILNNPAN